MKLFALFTTLAVLGLLISVATAAPADAAASTTLDATGSSPSLAMLVPEPCTAGLLSLGAVALAFKRVRRRV